MRYYDIHINYDGTKEGAGYSIFVKANVSSEDEALQYAIETICLRKMEMKNMLIM